MSRRKNQKQLSRAVYPVKPRQTTFSLLFAGVFLLAVGTVFFNVQRTNYGGEIRRLNREKSLLGSEVRDLRSQKADMISLKKLRSTAEGLGMYLPPQKLAKLRVRVPEGEVPPTWKSPGMEMLFEGSPNLTAELRSRWRLE